MNKSEIIDVADKTLEVKQPSPMISDVKYMPQRKFRDLSVAELSSRSVPLMYSAGRAAFIMIHTWTRIRLNDWGDRAELEMSIELLVK